jgi:hypothetical protein
MNTMQKPGTKAASPPFYASRSWGEGEELLFYVYFINTMDTCNIWIHIRITTQ